MFIFGFRIYIIVTLLYYRIQCLPQHPEINDQFQTQETTTEPIEENSMLVDDVKVTNATARRNEMVPTVTIMMKICNTITEPFKKFISTPKVTYVLRNIGTCIVNGAIDIISYYFPAPLIPLIASAAGFVIPFEPVVILKEKMPVTSYRRAFASAMHSFMSAFDKYKIDEDPDPYMTRRFNRRFMNNIDDKKDKSENVADKND